MDVWIWIAIVFLILLIGISVGVYAFYKLKKSSSDKPRCNTSQQDSECVYYLEKYPDSSITTPGQTLYLGAFSYSRGAGPALCQPMWYAFRYVRQSDGGYGPLSDWTPASQPIFAGSCNLPCAPKVCGSTLVPPTGNSHASVTYNAPQVVTVSTLDYPLYQGYVANIHRYVGTDPTIPPPAGTEGTIIGTLETVSSSSHGFTSQFIDVLFNPNPGGGSTCNVMTCT